MFGYSQRKTHVMSFGATEREKKKIEDLSRRSGTTLSEIIRRGLGAGLPVIEKELREISTI